MTRQGTFYLSRVIKGGRLRHDQLVHALQEPKGILYRDYGWTFTDYHNGPDNRWHYAKLTKYRPEGVVTVIDHDQHREVPQGAPDLVAAASPFVYVPEFSGISYLHVWNQIQREAFPQRFCEVVEASLGHFFVHCELEPIADLRSFARKLSSLDTINGLQAKVHLPNPLFGPLWKSLRDYVAQRNAETVRLEEFSPKGTLKTELPRLVEQVVASEVAAEVETEVAIGDAAVLMAADGYGSARITGTSGRRPVTVRTSETQVNFTHSATAEPADLAERTIAALEQHSVAHGLKHGH
jgi:hypothetical protein